ncbi:hypothetical protein [Cohnella sp. WQ 127256]|uniref:hypothetical protein n=1 Tax=Cohnella sp. WQ 127256 TaxID=2938790 RepID=UPI002119601F|nr:hypothetical protein [Cohnella sp. WQ 127256]
MDPSDTIPIDYIFFIFNEFESFGFLTDFSTTHTLEEAPIVVHEPLGDIKARIIAGNLMEFLQVLITVKSIHYIDSETIDEDPDEETTFVLNKIKDYFGIEPIQDLDVYRENLLKHRLENVVINTINDLGVVRVSSHNSSLEHKTITLDKDGDYEQYLHDVKNFFGQENCSIESKFGCIRNIQEDCNLSAPGVTEFLIMELEKLGFFHEVERLRFILQSNPKL